MLLALVSVVYSALRAGSNTALFRFASGEADAADQPLLDDETGRNYVKVRAPHIPPSPLSMPNLTRQLIIYFGIRTELALAWAPGVY